MASKITPYLQQITDLIVHYAGSFILAILVFLFGWWLIKKFVRRFEKIMIKRDIDLSLRPFLKSIITFSLRLMLIIAVASMVGIKMTSFIAVLGAAGLAIGLALQGSLSNFAGGIIILLLKPFIVGEFIETNGLMGTVREIKVFYTYITTIHNQEEIIPNGTLANSIITNYSRHDSRRMDMTFRVGYESDLSKVKGILEELITAEKALVEEPSHSVFVQELAEHYIIVNVRAWLKSDEFWDVHNSFSEKVKYRFDQEHIRIPHPIMEVNLSGTKA